ncbi:hypothetical protein [Georgenia sp. AZ-5]|uniref:hypothetical protein n=1 Tax=Georgenia sp. AZ-5 TaxID=3367526 RepID=UPI003754F081
MKEDPGSTEYTTQDNHRFYFVTDTQKGTAFLEIRPFTTAATQIELSREDVQALSGILSVISLESDLAALGLDPVRHRHIIQTAIRRAGVECEEADHRAIEAVRNVGYRIVAPQEHGRLAVTHQRKSIRALRAGRSKVENVDLDKLDPEARKAFGIMALAFAAQIDFNRRLDVRQKRLEEAVKHVSVRTERSEEEIATLRERLDRLERQRHD